MRALTRTEWLVCIAAGLGFAFDLYESIMNALIVGPSITSLTGWLPGSPEFNSWVGWFFLIPMVTGGVAGFYGGYLTDRFGRRRVLVWSIVIYSGSAAAASHATSLPALLLFRCTTLVGVCVEAVAAVAWIAELFPEPRRRERVLALTQACYPIGGVLVSVAYFAAVTAGEQWPAICGAHEAWRYTLLSGLLPAFPLMVLRPFLPESPLWLAQRGGATARPPRLREFLSPPLAGRTSIITMICACTLALSFGALQHTPRMVPGIAQHLAASPQAVQQLVSLVFLLQETGSISGRVLFAWLVVRVARRRQLLRLFLYPSLVIFAAVFFFAASRSVIAFAVGAFLAQALFNCLHSFWGNYLPRMFPTRLRGTGESVAMNLGGRVLAVTAAMLTTQLAGVMPGDSAALKLSYAAGTTATFALAAAGILSRWLPEPDAATLPE